MLEGLFTEMAQPIPPLFDAVPSVPSLKNQREPLQPTNDGAVPSVPPVPSQKTKTESKKQRILNWLSFIGETDPAIIEDTLNRCRADQETLRYFLTRANETQRASVAAKLANMQHGGDRKSDQAENLPLVSQAKAAEMLNVSDRSLRTAKKVQEEAIPEITEKMSAGEISLNSAAMAARPIKG